MGSLQFRSNNRDLTSDERRISAIRSTVQAAISEADAELAGLSKRLRADSDIAAVLFGYELESQTTGDAILDLKLRLAEDSITRGELRREELMRHVERLWSIQASVDRSFPLLPVCGVGGRESRSATEREV